MAHYVAGTNPQLRGLPVVATLSFAHLSRRLILTRGVFTGEPCSKHNDSRAIEGRSATKIQARRDDTMILPALSAWQRRVNSSLLCLARQGHKPEASVSKLSPYEIAAEMIMPQDRGIFYSCPVLQLTVRRAKLPTV
jgi:hypothetical protein